MDGQIDRLIKFLAGVLSPQIYTQLVSLGLLFADANTGTGNSDILDVARLHTIKGRCPISTNMVSLVFLFADANTGRGKSDVLDVDTM